MSNKLKFYIVTGKGEKNEVLTSLDERNALRKIARNAEYLNKLDRAYKDVKADRVIEKHLTSWVNLKMTKISFCPIVVLSCRGHYED